MQGAFGKIDSICVIFEVEENPCQVEQQVRVVGREREGFAETLYGQLCVAFDSPEVANLVEDS